MGKCAVIIFHGTDQDSRSVDENTVKLAGIARAAGLTVHDFAGPGSVDNVLLLGDRYATSYYFDESPGLGDLFVQASGTALGLGVRDNVEDALARIEQLVAAGTTEIKLVGFSRGAYSIAKLLPLLEEKGILARAAVEAVLLDPVPGPLRRKVHRVPAGVRRFTVLYAQHEGRPGFTEASFFVEAPESTRTRIEVWTGVHGDLGGSTRSAVADLALDFVVRAVLGRPLYSMAERAARILDAAEAAPLLTTPGWMHAFWVRAMRANAGVGLLAGRGQLTLPNPESHQWMQQVSPAYRFLVTPGGGAPRSVQLVTEWDRRLARMVAARVEAAAAQDGELQRAMRDHAQSQPRGSAFHRPPVWRPQAPAGAPVRPFQSGPVPPFDWDRWSRQLMGAPYRPAIVVPQASIVRPRGVLHPGPLLRPMDGVTALRMAMKFLPRGPK